MKVFSNLLICELKFLCCFFLLNLVFCLHEDQTDKFDSKLQYIGKVKFAYIDPLLSETHKFVVATEENVVACLNTLNDNIVWRQNLEKGKLGEIDALSDEGNYPHQPSIITVNGGGRFIRFWNITTGKLMCERNFPHPQNTEAVSYFKINVYTKEIIKIEILPKKHAKVYVYDYLKDSLKTSNNIASLWFDENTKCDFFSGKYFVCMEPHRKVLQRLSVKDGAFTPVHLSSLDHLPESDIPDWDRKNTELISVLYQDSIDNPMVVIQTNKKNKQNFSNVFININPPELRIINREPGFDKVTSAVIDGKFVLFSIKRTDDRSSENSTYEVRAFLSQGYWNVEGLKGKFSLSKHRGALIKTFYILPYTQKEHGISYKLLLLFEDNSALLYHQHGRLIWSREETLSNISVKIHRIPSEEL